MVQGTSDSNRFKTSGIVGSHRRWHNQQLRSMGTLHSQRVLQREVERSQVQTVPWFGRNPSWLCSHILFYDFKELFSIEIRQCDLFRWLLEPVHVALRPKHSNFSLFILVSFLSFVALHSIMQRRIKRMDFQFLERFNFGFAPDPLSRHNGHHVISVLLTERQVIEIQILSSSCCCWSFY